MKKVSFLITITMFFAGTIFSQGVGIKSDASATDNSAMLEIKSTSQGILIPRMTAMQRGAINSPANGLMVYQTDTPAGFYYYEGTSWKLVGSSGQHYIGELYGGGVVFWVDDTGQHGLIVSMTDVSSSQRYSNNSSTLIGQTAQSDWDGMTNSNAVVGQAGHTASAAQVCLDYVNADYGTGIFSDWYLPSRTEFFDLWNNLKAVSKAFDTDGNPATTPLNWLYWTSTESNAENAWTFQWWPGKTYVDSKSNQYQVRAVRAF
jgi:hypothetical protein